VVAGDRFGSGIATNLTVHVLDVNDNPPVFGQRVYNFSVTEDSYNENVGRVKASDVDTGSTVLYRLIGDAGPFIIEPNKGMVK